MPVLDDPVALSFLGISIRWYALFILAGIVVGILVARRLAAWRGLDPGFVLDLAPWMVAGGIIGARLYYVLLKWRFFVDHPAEVVNTREGGLAVHGAIAGGVIAFLLCCRWRDQRPWAWVDPVAAAVPFGQAIGRWGNWANQEAFGSPTNAFWAVRIDPAHRPAGYEQFSTFHPTFLYESLLDLALGLVLVMAYLGLRRSWPLREGDVLALFLMGYGCIRFTVEQFRLDSVYVHGFRVASLVSLALIVTGLAILIAVRTIRPTRVIEGGPGDLQDGALA